eukprot:959098-Rhodomonas_salina.1
MSVFSYQMGSRKPLRSSKKRSGPDSDLTTNDLLSSGSDVASGGTRHMSNVLIAQEHGRLSAKKAIEELETQQGQLSPPKPLNPDRSSNSAETDAMKRQVEQLNREKAEADAQKKTFEAENHALKKQIEQGSPDMQTELARAQDERKEALSQLQEKDALLEQLKARVAKTRRESFVTKEAHGELEQRVADAEGQLAE